MNTYLEIYKDIIADKNRANTMNLVPKDYTLIQMSEMAAKEYAKQWVDRCADVAMDNVANGLPVGDAIYALKNQIDKQ